MPARGRKPRVLLLTPDFPPALGGIQLMMHRLVQHWGRVETRIVTLSASDGGAFDHANGLNVRRVRRPKGLGRAGTIGMLNAAALVEALRFRPDITVSGHINVSPSALAIRRVLGVRYVQYLYGREVVVRPALSRMGIRHATSVVAISSYTERLALRHGADPGRIHCIPPGVDVVSVPEGARADRPTVLTVARLEERYKGHDVLIRAMPLVRARVPKALLIIVGDGHLRGSYERLAAALGVSEGVHFAGAFGGSKRDVLLEQAHVFAMTSRLPPDGGGEGFGIVYLEAGLHGLPVVAGAVGGAVDAVVDQETGLLVDPTDHVAVAEAVTELLTCPDKAAAFGRAGAARAKQYSWPLIASRVEDLVLATVAAR